MADSSSTGRNFILTGVVLGLGAAAAGFYVSSSFDKQEIDFHMPSADGVATLSQKTKATYDEAVRDTRLADIAPKDAWVARDKVPGADGKMVKNPEGKVPRYAPLFFAPQLWLVSEGAGKVAVRDLLAMENPEKPDVTNRVHKDVPNEWFFRYGLDQIIGESNALAQDSDGDGFTNEEEFAAGTDPADASKYPAFVQGDAAKMVCTGVHSKVYMLELSSMSNFDDPAKPVVVINIYNDKDMRIGQAKIDKSSEEPSKDSFGLPEGVSGAAKNAARFKITSYNAGADGENAIEVEDTYTKQESAKKFVLRPGKKNSHRVSDIEATFRMTAGSDKGKALSRNIQLGESFAVPGFPDVVCTFVSSKKKEIKVKIGDSEVKIDKIDPEKHSKTK